MKGKIIVSAVTGLEKIEDRNGVKIFPNPANDFITLQNLGNLIIEGIKIIDISGRIVLNIQKPYFIKENEMLDIRNLNKGIYFISVISDEKKYTEKFLKQ